MVGDMHAIGLRRRAMLGAGAVACLSNALPAGAQGVNRLKRIGWLDFSSAAENLGVFKQALKSRGWIDGKTSQFEYRGAEGKLALLAAAAAELVRLPADVIVVPGSQEALAAQQATKTTPVVLAGLDDPVSLGLIESLARPHSNVTGLAIARGELVAKVLSLMREQFPRAATAGVLWDNTDPDLKRLVDQLHAAAASLRLTLRSVAVKHHTEVEGAMVSLRDQGAQFIVVPGSRMLVPRWLADLSQRHKLPLASDWPAYAYEGGLMSYSADWFTVFAQVAGFVDRILKGHGPADLPVELPTKYRLVINSKTAQSLGFSLASSLMLRADYIVE